MDKNITDDLKSKYPQLEQIHAAIKEFKRDGKVTTRCQKCRNVISVVEVPEAGVLETSCPCGLCRYRMKWQPQGNLSP
jgi:hypothetical protein